MPKRVELRLPDDLYAVLQLMSTENMLSVPTLIGTVLLRLVELNLDPLTLQPKPGVEKKSLLERAAEIKLKSGLDTWGR